MATFRRFSQLTAATTIADTDIFAASQLSLDVTITAATISMSEIAGGLVDSGSGFIAAGFAVGDQVNITGFTISANNLYSATITDLTSGTMQIVVDESESSQDILDEPEGDTVTVTKWETRRVSKLDLEAYEPSSDGEWQGSGPPGTYSEAIDELVARLAMLEVEAGNQSIIVACSDETTALTTGDAKVTFRVPYNFNLSAVKASVTTAPTGANITVNIRVDGSDILSTPITIEATEKTSILATTQPVISDASLTADQEVKIDLDAVGSTIPGAGLKVTLIGLPGA